MTFSTAAVIAFAAEQTIIYKILCIPPIRFTGKLSYSLYLWHWPLWCFATFFCLENNIHLQTNIKLLLLFIVYIASFLTWRFIENPLRKRLASWRRVCATLCPGFLLLISASAVALIAEAPKDLTENWKDRQGNAFCDGESFTVGSTKESYDFAAIGDSHLKHYLPLFESLATSFGVKGELIIRSDTLPFRDLQLAKTHSEYVDKTTFANAALEWIKQHQVSNIIISCRWNYYLFSSAPRLNTNYDQEDHYPVFLNGNVTSDYSNEMFQSHFMRLLKSLNTSTTRIWIIEQVPELPSDPKLIRELTGNNPAPDSDYHQRRTARFQKIILETHTPNLVYIPTSTPFALGNKWTTSINGTLLYADDDHLNSSGAMLLSTQFQQIFRDIRASRDNRR
jgi:hypothetical protein